MPSARIVLDQAARVFRRAARRNLHQHVPGPLAGERRRGAPAYAAATKSSGVLPISSKAVRLLPARSSARPNSASAASGDGNAGPGDLAALRLREELQHGGGDDAERAFGADEQVLQVVAGVVLLQLAQVVEHLAGRQHDLDAEAELARIAIGEHAGAAGIGRRGCRRSGRSPARPATAGTGGRRRRRRPCSVSSTTPASAVMVLDSGSISRMRLSRDSDSTISRPAAVAAPGRRPGRCCRPAARPACASRWRASGCG